MLMKPSIEGTRSSTLIIAALEAAMLALLPSAGGMQAPLPTSRIPLGRAGMLPTATPRCASIILQDMDDVSGARRSGRFRSFRFDDDEEDMPDDYEPEQAQTFIDYNFVADYGWDPLRLSRFDLNLGSGLDKERPIQYVIRDYREAELRHGRLAMLAALAWPVQELLSPVLSRALREPILVAETQMSCSSMRSWLPVMASSTSSSPRTMARQ